MGTQNGVKCLLGPGCLPLSSYPISLDSFSTLCSENLSFALAVPVAGLFEGEKHSAHIVDARRVPVSDVSQLTLAQSEVKKLVTTLHRTKRRTV